MAPKKGINQLRFGGWYSYREWAEHGFTPKSTHDRPTKPEPEPDSATGKPAPSASSQNSGQAPAPPKDTVPSAREHDEARVDQWSDSGGDPALDLYPAPPRPDRPLIRPYILTSGRTRPRHELAVHTLILTTERGRAATGGLLSEWDTICRLCETAQSVAEVSALLEVPLSVARVVIDDMEYEGLIEIVASAHDSSESVDVLTRILEGLREL